MFKKLILSLCLLAAFSACGGNNIPAPEAPVITVTQEAPKVITSDDGEWESFDRPLAPHLLKSGPTAQFRKKAGYGYYGLLHKKWPCVDSRANDAKNPTLKISVLWNTFGQELECLGEYLRDPRTTIFQLHLVNEVCQKNGNCSPHEFLAKISKSTFEKKLKAKDPKLLASISAYAKDAADKVLPLIKPHTQCYISPGLEPNTSAAAGKVFLNTVKPFFPNCKFVWGGEGTIAGTLSESHGDRGPKSVPCIANLDGQDIDLKVRKSTYSNKISASKIPAYFEKNKQCDATFLWIAEFNGRKDVWTPPLERKNWPSGKVLKEVSNLTRK